MCQALRFKRAFALNRHLSKACRLCKMMPGLPVDRINTSMRMEWSMPANYVCVEIMAEKSVGSTPQKAYLLPVAARVMTSAERHLRS